MSSYKIEILKTQIITFLVMVCVFINLPTSTLLSQSDTSLIRIIKESEQLIKAKKYTEADSLLLLSRTLSRENKDWDSWLKTIKSQRKIANALMRYQSLVDSLLLYMRIPPESETNIHGKLKYYLASTKFKQARVAEAINYWTISLPYFENTNDTTFYCATLKNLGTAYSRMQDQNSALKIMDQGIDYLSKNKEVKYYKDFVLNKGTYYLYNQQLEKSRQAYLFAQEYYPDREYINLQLAHLDILLGNLTSAEKILDNIKQPPKDHNEKYYHQYASLLENEKENLPKAISHQKEVVRIVNSQRYLRTQTRELSKLAQLYLDAGDKQNAIAYAHDAICNLYPKVDTSDVNDLPADTDIPDLHIINALYVKAQCQETNKLDIYKLMFRMFEDLKNNISTNDSRYRIGVFSKAMYADGIKAYLEEYEKTKNIKDYEQALILAQLSNSSVLRNTISERKALEIANVPPSLVDEFLNYKNEISQAYENNENNILDSLIIPYNELKAQINEKHPSFESYSRGELISLADIKSNLKENEILLKYFFDENTLICFSITKSNQGYSKIVLEKEDLESLRRLKEMINEPDPAPEVEAEFTQTSKAIYEQIFAVVEDNSEFRDVKQIFIVPDGPLKNLSFNALMHRESNSWTDFENYLISKYQISYLYYASQLFNTDKGRNANLDFVGFGIKYQDEYLNRIKEEYFQNTRSNERAGEFQLSILKNAIDEVKECAALLGGLHFTDEMATKESIKENLREARIAHFAMHSIADQSDFLNSYLLLKADDKLHSQFKYRDILKLNLNSDLIVLSACQTNTGSDIDGEGLMSMARAFIQSGSQATLGTYWNAHDFSTRKIMNLFYQGIKSGQNKSEALRQAQLEYLSNDEISSPALRSPFYWAGWSLYGNVEAVSTPGIPTKLIFLSIAMLAFCLVGYRLYTRKN